MHGLQQSLERVRIGRSAVSVVEDYRETAPNKQEERSKMQKFIIYGVLLGSVALAGCHGGLISSSVERAEAQLKPTAGNTVNGTVYFSQAGEKVRVIAEVSGLTPGAHGFHIHERGDCSAPDGTSAGGHYNPHGAQHGHPETGNHHAGDMPQLIADAQGNAKMVTYLAGLDIKKITGLGVIVHAAPDDFKTQPTGNSGARQACGAIIKR
jgi:Cu-Zn family superoxide dismutase